MVKKVTLLELHLDDARFSNAVTSSAEEAKGMLDRMDMSDVDDGDEMDDMDETMAMGESSSRSPVGRALRMAVFAVVVAVGVRTIARRFLGSNDAEATIDDDSIEVDLDEPVEA